jgi:hypothetical protein
MLRYQKLSLRSGNAFRCGHLPYGQGVLIESRLKPAICEAIYCMHDFDLDHSTDTIRLKHMPVYQRHDYTLRPVSFSTR